MDGQQVVSLVIVGLTAVLLVRSLIRRRRRGGLPECAGCAHAGQMHAINKHSLHARKEEYRKF